MVASKLCRQNMMTMCAVFQWSGGIFGVMRETMTHNGHDMMLLEIPHWKKGHSSGKKR